MSNTPDGPLPPLQPGQGFSPEDGSYEGSTFREVRDAIFGEPRYYAVWAGPGKSPLPVYPLTLWTLLRGFLRWSRYPFFQAAKRTVDSHADLRWGQDRKGVRRMLHPNGICLTGTWEITEPTEYTGYFRQGSKGLLIGRYSVGGGVRRGEKRSLALVGKLYPTTDPDSSERMRPAAFITQEDFGGPGAAYINDAELRNAPDTHAFRRGFMVFSMLSVIGIVFGRADTHATFRQLYEIAELGKPESEQTSAPEFFRLLVDENQPRIEGDGIDFRDEILAQIYDAGDPAPKRQLVFNIEVSDTGTTRGLAFNQRRTITNWKRIGRLVFTEAVVSYNGDFVIHFHHPGWRQNRNDPSTAIRQGGQRVR